MEQITVWVDSWQMQCCGQPFKIGTQVKWLARRWKFDPIVECGQIDYSYEGHGEEDMEIAGKVADIKAVYTMYAPNDDILKSKPVSHILVDVKGEADGWEDRYRGEHKFDGYLVKLNNAIVEVSEGCAQRRKSKGLPKSNPLNS
jgi:hypothetical protein